MDLVEWAARWLKAAGRNSLAVEWEQRNGRIAKLELVQTAPADHPVLRPHRVDVGLITADGSLLNLPATIDDRRQLVKDAEAIRAPVLVFPNYGDHGYAKIALDPVSTEWALESVDAIEEVLLRQQVWASLWEMTRDGLLTSTDYLALARRALAAEPDLALVRMVTSTVPVSPAESESACGDTDTWNGLTSSPSAASPARAVRPANTNKASSPSTRRARLFKARNMVQSPGRHNVSQPICPLSVTSVSSVAGFPLNLVGWAAFLSRSGDQLRLACLEADGLAGAEVNAQPTAHALLRIHQRPALLELNVRGAFDLRLRRGGDQLGVETIHQGGQPLEDALDVHDHRLHGTRENGQLLL